MLSMIMALAVNATPPLVRTVKIEQPTRTEEVYQLSTKLCSMFVEAANKSTEAQITEMLSLTQEKFGLTTDETTLFLDFCAAYEAGKGSK